jgi:hypothetical protein
MTELQKKFRCDEPLSQRNHADLMQRIWDKRGKIDALIGEYYSHVLLYALGRITPIPDADMPRFEVEEPKWTGD